jgi:hypothetical protein
LNDNDLPPGNLSPIDRVKILYQFDSRDESEREIYGRIILGNLWLPRKVDPDLRTMMMMSQQSRIMRSRDMNRLRCHHVNRLMGVHRVVMSRVIIITFHARTNANANGKDLGYLILQLA